MLGDTLGALTHGESLVRTPALRAGLGAEETSKLHEMDSRSPKFCCTQMGYQLQGHNQPRLKASPKSTAVS